MQDLLQTLKGDEIWLNQAKEFVPPSLHRYYDEQIAHCQAMYAAVLRLGIHNVKPDDKSVVLSPIGQPPSPRPPLSDMGVSLH